MSDNATNPDQLVRYSFISHSSIPLTLNQIKNIKKDIEERNSRLGITGVLHIYKNINLQTLEGKWSNIKNILNIIKSDPKHSNFKMFSFENITEDERIYNDNQVCVVSKPNEYISSQSSKEIEITDKDYKFLTGLLN